MANNCYNYISIEGVENEILELSKLLSIDASQGQDSGFDIYSNLIATFGKFGNDGRWFDIDISLLSETQIIISGDSAWCPCLEIFTEISKKYPSLLIRYEYEEMGCDFAGWAEIKEGECSDNCFNYWDGMFELKGENEVLEMVINNELECYETEEEFKKADFFPLFSEENQAEILKEYSGAKVN